MLACVLLPSLLICCLVYLWLLGKDETTYDNGVTVAGIRHWGWHTLQPNDAFGQVIGAERGGRVRGVGFGLTSSSNHARSMDDSTPPLTSTETDQRVIELFTQVEAMRLMRRMLTSLCPSFPSMSMVRSLNTKYMHFCSCLYGDWWVVMKFCDAK